MPELENWTREEFMGLPLKGWNEDVGEFDSFIIIPAEINRWEVIKWKIISWIDVVIFHRDPTPDWRVISGMHDSHYRSIDYVLIREGIPFCRTGGGSDVLHINGIGGYGYDWLHQYGKVPDSIPPIGWTIDCLPESGLLRVFTMENKLLRCGPSHSSFEVYAIP